MRKIINSKYIWAILGLLLSGVTLYLALREVSLWEVSREVRQAGTGWVVFAVVSVLINTFLKGIRWYRLTGEVGRQAGVRRVIAANLAGQLLNLIYPARAGDVSRVLIIGRGGNEKAFVLGSVVLEKLADLVAYVLLSLILLVRLPFPDWLSQSVYVAVGVTILGMVLTGWWVSDAARGERLANWLVRRKVGWLPERTWQQIIELVQMALAAIGLIRQRKMLFELTLWTAFIWLTALGNNILIWNALGMQDMHPGKLLPATLLLLLGLMAGIAVPSVPGRIGVFEYICILALAVFGVSQAQALTYGIVLHAVVLFPALILGATALLWLSWKPASQPLKPD